MVLRMENGHRSGGSGWRRYLPASTRSMIRLVQIVHKARTDLFGSWQEVPGIPALRDCAIPAGKAILFPALTSECSYAEDSTLKSETQLRSCAMNSVEGGIAQVSVDGMNFQALQTYRVQSPLFNFTFPKDNIFGAPAGPTQSVSDGIFLLLQALPPGNHTVHFTGVVLANPTLGTQSFATDATYHLVVK